MSRQPVIVGHRGWPSHYPENSQMGMQAAINAGVVAIEIDVQLTRDGVPIVMHDRDSGRVSQQNVDVLDSDWCDLQTLSVHEPARFAEQFDQEPILKLESLVSLNTPKMQWFIELKEDPLGVVDSLEYATLVVEACKPVLSQCVFISYNRELVESIRLKFGLPVGWVMREYNAPSHAFASAFKPEYLICNVKKIGSPDQLWSLPVTWFLYDIVDVDECIKWSGAGVDYIESWDPVALLDSLNVARQKC